MNDWVNVPSLEITTGDASSLGIDWLKWGSKARENRQQQAR